jgi:hypothetical protein
VKQKMQMNKAMLKGNKEERKRRRKDGIYGPPNGIYQYILESAFRLCMHVNRPFFLGQISAKSEVKKFQNKKNEMIF